MSIETELSTDEVSQLNEMKANLTKEEPAHVEEVKEEVKVENADEAVLSEVKTEVKKEEPEKVKTVPHGAFHEERMRRKQAEKDVQDLREKFARADERIKALAERAAPEKVPDPNEDPLAYESYERQRLTKEFVDKSKSQEEEIKNLKVKQEQLELKTYIDSQERVFQADHPDYNQALQYLVNTRISVLEDVGVEEEERMNVVQQEFTDIVNRAVKAGKNPAEAVYKMASKMGYSPKKEVKETKNLDSIKKGVDASKSLSGSGKTNIPLSAEALASMSDEDFEDLKYEDFAKTMRG